MTGVIDVALGFDTQYAPHAGAVIASIVRHAPSASFRFICLHDGVDKELQAKVEACGQRAAFVWCEISEEDLPAFDTKGHLSRAILFRLGLERLAPADCRRVLYIDADVIVCADISELWSADLGPHALGGMRDAYQDGAEFAKRWSLPAESPRYFNSGVLLIDLEQVRRDRLFSAAADFVARHGEQILLGDQDALNWVFWERWTELDPAWNVQRFLNSEEIRNANWRRPAPALVHFIGYYKPWMPNIWHPWAWAYWESLKHTPFEADVVRAYKMDFYQLMRLRMKWWLNQPPRSRAS
jgi:lipopolysaccharide biosynthesis glycosyltransferase